jgi:hypothetical protein
MDIRRMTVLQTAIAKREAGFLESIGRSILLGSSKIWIGSSGNMAGPLLTGISLDASNWREWGPP